MLNERALEGYGHISTATSSSYVPTIREQEIFFALFYDNYLFGWNNPLFRSEPIPVAPAASKQLDWYDEEGLNEIWQAIGDEQIAFAEMGMDDYILNLQQLDED